MKTNTLTISLLATLLVISCQKQPMEPDCTTSSTSQNVPAFRDEPVSLFSGEELLTHLPVINDAQYDQVVKTTNDGSITEGTRVYHINESTGEDICMSIGDFANADQNLYAFLIGKGISMQSPAAPDAGLSVELDGQMFQLMIAASIKQGVINFSNGLGVWGPDGLDAVKRRSRMLSLSSGSNFVAYNNPDEPEVQGWTIYDNSSNTAMLLLVVKERYCVLFEHQGASSPETILALSKFTNVQGLEKR